LIDENREFAVLQAASSAGGIRMLEREHKLKVGQTGIVGYVAATGFPRIALDVGADAIYFDNPDLPETRSEIALPMNYAGKLMGVLDVQSAQPNAFSREDTEILSTLADQVAVAINNAKSLYETRKLLDEVSNTSASYISQAWKILRPVTVGTGFQKAGLSIKPLDKPLQGEHIQKAVESGQTTVSSCKLAVPIRLRGQVIGVMNLQIPDNHIWSSDEVDIAEAVAERLSLAIETATLLQSTQRRADIERITTEISGKISSSTRFETILQTAAQELSRVLGGSDVLVQIEPVSIQLSSSS
jgi:putative methionine-R-sulfoxide reductase with GAF domain